MLHNDFFRDLRSQHVSTMAKAVSLKTAYSNILKNLAGWDTLNSKTGKNCDSANMGITRPLIGKESKRFQKKFSLEREYMDKHRQFAPVYAAQQIFSWADILYLIF